MIYTFYSYKGGVGRSMAMANVGRWMAMRGLRVTLVDWDLEAPGIESFFREGDRLDSVRSSPGLIDLLLDYRDRYPHIQRTSDKVGRAEAMQNALLPLSSHSVPLEEHGAGTLTLVPAGFRAEGRFQDYAAAVQRFDWQDFYTSFEGATYFEWLRSQLLVDTDVVLIDSRTGVTEMGGVCTRQLADVVVSFAAGNYQNLDGVVRMMRSFVRPDVQEFREKVRGGGNAPLMVAVPARIDLQSETDRRNWFREQFREHTDEFLPKVFRASGGFWELRLPYIAKYAFREELVIGEDDADEELEEAYERLGERLLGLLPDDSSAAARLTKDREARLRKYRHGEPEPFQPESLLDRAVRLEASLDAEEQEMLRWVLLRLLVYQGPPLRALTGRQLDPEGFDRLLDRLVAERIVLTGNDEAWFGLDLGLAQSWPLVEKLREDEAELLGFLEQLRSAMALEQPLRRTDWAASQSWSTLRPEVFLDTELEFIEASDDLRRQERTWWRTRFPQVFHTRRGRWSMSVAALLIVALLGVASPALGGFALLVMGGSAAGLWAERRVYGPITATGAGLPRDPEPPPWRVRWMWPANDRRFTYELTFHGRSIRYFEFTQEGKAHRRAWAWDVCVRSDGDQVVVEGPASVVRRMVKPFRKDMRFARPKAPD